MMNGVLEEKQEKSGNNQLEGAEWENRDRDNMNEEELAKYEEFIEKQEKLKEDQEKMRKILNQELKKIMNEIKNACSDFDEQLTILFIKRLEYQYRIYEQELIMIKLKQLLTEETIINYKVTFSEQLKNKESETLDKKMLVYAYLKSQIEKEHEILSQLETEVSKFETKGLKQIFQTFIPNKDEQSRRFVEFESRLERYGRENSFFNVSQRDPSIIFEKQRLTKILEYEPDFYQDVVREFLSKKFDNEYDIQNEMTKFAKLLVSKKAAKQKSKEIALYQNLFTNFERQIEEHKTNLNEMQKNHELIHDQKEKHLTNAFLIFRAYNQNIEVNRDKPVIYSDDTILIEQSTISKINKSIITNGNKKLDLLIGNYDEKKHVEQDLSDMKRLELEIKEAMIETLILTRLKVSKKLQTVISKNDVKLMEHEEKNIKKQIEKLVSSTEKTVASLKKKEFKMRKEINFIAQENKDLLYQGGILQESVAQRQEIFNMVFGKTDGDENLPNDQMNSRKEKFDDKAYKKTLEVIQNRKLYDTAKHLAEEIEGLMKELKLLQKRSFPDIKSN